MKLKDKVAIVTGGGRGIGRAIALAFAREGAKIAVVSRTMSEVKQAADEILAMGGHCIALKSDISDKENVDYIVRSTVRELGEINILVNNAGVQGPIGLLVENDMERWINTIHINLIGTCLCTRAVLPIMIKNRRGKIINLSGGGSTSPRPHFTAYAVSKAAVVRFTETVAEEVREFNIQVNAIAPGAVNTRMLEEVLTAGEAAGSKVLAESQKQLGTGGTPPEKAAALAVFLASDESDGLTGRLISAVWDNWPDMKDQISEIMSSDLYTLRRVVNKSQ